MAVFGMRLGWAVAYAEAVSPKVQAAFDVSGSLHFGFWGAGCFQVAFGRLVRI